MARTIAAASAGSTRNRGVLLLAALFGVLSAGLMFAFLSNRGGSESEIDEALRSGDGAETVVVVTRDIAAGEKITSDMLTTRPVPAGALLTGRITDPAEVIGKVATAPLFIGEQAIVSKVTTFEGQTTLAYKIPQGLRALSLQIPHEAWGDAGLVQPGDRVDVLGMTTLMKVDPLTGEEKPIVLSGIIAQDVEVLAVSQVLVKKVPKTDLQGGISGGGTNLDGNDTGTGAEPATTTGDTSGETALDPTGGSVVATTVKEGEEAPTYEEALSITLALAPELAAKVGIIDAMKDDVAQYRILARQKGDSEQLTGNVTWTLEDVFPASTKK